MFTHFLSNCYKVDLKIANLTRYQDTETENFEPSRCVSRDFHRQHTSSKICFTIYFTVQPILSLFLVLFRLFCNVLFFTHI